MELDRFADLAQALADQILRATLQRRALRLVERGRAGEFHVAVLGEFKRGKSTLVNALVGQAVLPSGVLPLTALATEVSFGEPAVEVLLADRSQLVESLDALAGWVTEAENPNNEKKVARVRVRVPASLLTSGLTLVDTPGVGSIHEHNTEAAGNAADAADGAIVVLAADAPLSADEEALLKSFRQRQARVFVVVNKADHVSGPELDEVLGFVREAGFADLQIWPMSARAALDAALDGGSVDAGFDAFRGELERFVELDLVAERDRTLARDAASLRDAIREDVDLAGASAALDAADLVQRVASFRAAVTQHRGAFEEDRLLLANEVRAIARWVGDELLQFSRDAAKRRVRELASLAEGVRTKDLYVRLDQEVQAIVETEYDAFRASLAESTERQWRRIAERFSGRVEQRIGSVRTAASDLFEIVLPEIKVPAVAAQPDKFFYLFLPDNTRADPLINAARHLLPSSVVRRRTLSQAQGRLREEFDKHAGRIRHDLTRRLTEAQQALERLLGDELDEAGDAILRAAERGEELRSVGEEEGALRRSRDRALLSLADELVAAATEAG